MRLVLAGDAMPARGLKPYDEPAYLALLDLLRGADAAFANLETTVRELSEGTPNLTQGTPMSTPPRLLDELDWMGLRLLSCANNHATDYGDDGLLAMLAHLRRAGIAHAGAGANLAEARKPAYFDTAAGRVALIAATTFSTRIGRVPPISGPMPGGRPRYGSDRFQHGLYDRRSGSVQRPPLRSTKPSAWRKRGHGNARCSSARKKRRRIPRTR